MINRSMVGAFALAVSVTLPVNALSASIVDAFSSFWVLGDSLSDNGNLFTQTGGTTPASPPYADGRFSNGPVWNEPILSEFDAANKPAENFAVGGATAVADTIPGNNLATQVGALTAQQGDFGDRPLVSLWFGANDLFDLIADNVDPTAGAEAAANALADQITAIQALGVNDFLIFTLPDLGEIPNYALLQPDLVDEATEASIDFNAQLLERIDNADDALSVRVVDAFGLFNQLIADPTAFGVLDATLPCLFPSEQVAGLFGQPAICDADTASQRAFYDSVHPNAVIHAGLTGQAVAAAVPLPAGAPLLLLGLALLGALRLRRAA